MRKEEVLVPETQVINFLEAKEIHTRLAVPIDCARQLVKERETHGPFLSFTDLVERLPDLTGEVRRHEDVLSFIQPQTEPDILTALRQIGEGMERVLDALRIQYPRMPEVCIRFTPYSEKTRWLGFFSAGSSDRYPMISISGKYLVEGHYRKEETPQERLLETLLHEAAHLLNHVYEESTVGKYGEVHSLQFKHQAEALGLLVSKQEGSGWAYTCLTDAARQQYSAELALWEPVLATLPSATFGRRAAWYWWGGEIHGICPKPPKSSRRTNRSKPSDWLLLALIVFGLGLSLYSLIGM